MRRCRLLGHKWPDADSMPVVDADEPMVVRCSRCYESAIVYGWLRDAFKIVERR